MKLWGALVNLFGVLICFYLVAYGYNMTITNEKQFDELRLRYAMDYATEAGFRAAMGTDDLGIDYIDITDVKVSPSDALDAFESVMCLNYGISPSEEKKAMIESFMPTALMICSDGFYTAKITEYDDTPNNSVSGGSFRLKWGLKKPYIVDFGGASNKKMAINLQGTPLYTVEYLMPGNNLAVTRLDDAAASALISNSDKSVINTEISNEANLAIRLKNQNFTSTETDPQYFYIPEDFSTVANNAIKTPCFIAMIQNVTFAGTSKLQAMSVGGVRVTQSRKVVAFTNTVTNQMYYCYNYQLPKSLDDEHIQVLQYFSSTEEAARAGYQPHIGYLTKLLTE